jgi:hypothetical protein
VTIGRPRDRRTNINQELLPEQPPQPENQPNMPQPQVNPLLVFPLGHLATTYGDKITVPHNDANFPLKYFKGLPRKPGERCSPMVYWRASGELRAVPCNPDDPWSLTYEETSMGPGRGFLRCNKVGVLVPEVNLDTVLTKKVFASLDIRRVHSRRAFMHVNTYPRVTRLQWCCYLFVCSVLGSPDSCTR